MKKINNSKNTLVIGGSGFIGSHYLSFFKSRKNTVIAPTHTQLDITNKKKLLSFFKKTKPQFVINFAAISNTEVWAKEQGNVNGKTWKINVIGAKNLVDACKDSSSFLVQISTDAIFPGTSKRPGPYAEDAKPAADKKTINWYGVSKLKAEEAVKKLERNFAIVRISHPFGNPKHPRDLVAKTIYDIENKRAIFADQIFTPSFIDDILLTINEIQKKQISGIFHVGCKGLVTRSAFAKHLLKLLKKKTQLVDGSMETYINSSAPRNRLGGFLTDHTERKLGVTFHTWQDALKKTVQNLS